MFYYPVFILFYCFVYANVTIINDNSKCLCQKIKLFDSFVEVCQFFLLITAQSYNKIVNKANY